MLTVAVLKEKGSRVEEGLARCMNNETFYLRLVGMALKDGNFGYYGDEASFQAISVGNDNDKFLKASIKYH